jgi:hypothetical protein
MSVPAGSDDWIWGAAQAIRAINKIMNGMILFIFPLSIVPDF